MAEMSARIELGEWMSFINGIDSKLKNKTGLLKSIYGTIGYKNIIQHFDEQKDPDGNLWKLRSANTQAWYARMNKKSPIYDPRNLILVLTGDTRKSISPTSSRPRDSGSIIIEAGTDYSAKHDEGLSGMPKREFMGFDDNTMEKMAQSLLSLIMGER